MGLTSLMLQGREIPKGTKPNRVRMVRAEFAKQLENDLQKRYVWLAHCTRGVVAGEWGGRRRAKRRLKLAALIGKCDSFLGEATLPEFPARWEQTNLYYGYNACHKFAEEHGGNAMTLASESYAALLTGLNRICYRAPEKVVRREAIQFFRALEQWRTWCGTLGEDGVDGVVLADRLIAKREEIIALMPAVAVMTARRLPESCNNDWSGMLLEFAPEFVEKRLPDPGAPMCVLHAAMDTIGGYPGIRRYAS